MDQKNRIKRIKRVKKVNKSEKKRVKKRLKKNTLGGTTSTVPSRRGPSPRIDL